MQRNGTKLSAGWGDLLKAYDRDHLSEARLKTRLQGESHARQMLENKLGKFEDDDIHEFLSSLNADFWGEKTRKNRFMPAFYGSLANKIADSKVAFNHWTEKLWTAGEEGLDEILDDFWKKNEVNGGGTSLPTAILYLRDPEKYSIWLPSIEQGLQAISNSLKFGKRRTSVGYHIFNNAVQSVRQQLDFKPQSMDIVLVLAGKKEGSGKDDDFEILYQEFLTSFVDSDEGQKHLQSYTAQRKEALQSYTDICRKSEAGENVTDLVLLKFLPHANTQRNRAKGAWIHIAPVITKDIKQWFEGANWTKPQDWPRVSKAILQFVQSCTSNPENLSDHCEQFAETCPSKGFQMGILTPILNALKPDAFAIINNKPRLILNYFFEQDFPNGLQGYSDLNHLAFKFQEKYKNLLEEVSTDDVLPGDVFDMFSHWLVAVKKFSFQQSKVYKVAPGEHAEHWEACKDNGYIAIGWNELGDLTDLAKEEYEKRRDELLQTHTTWTKSGLGQVWQFSRIKDGDRIIANKGKKEILAIGTVVGPYYFVANSQYGHRLPVIWDDQTGREVNEPSWSGTLQKVSPERFKELRDAEPISDKSTVVVVPGKINPEYSLEKCSEDAGYSVSVLEQWARALDRKQQAVFYGPPGTGKTFLAKKLAKHIIGGKDGITELVQFHPEYAYQDFMQGIRPVAGKNGNLRYEMVPGVFRKFCAEAEACMGKCVLIIDEINRANLSRVFGELMYLLEYRNESVQLPGGGAFQIPTNVRIIGTMNTADRSIALVDHALRRRFAFIRLAPDYAVLEKFHENRAFPVKGLIDVLTDLNEQIGDPHYEIGISFFLVDNLENDVGDIWRMEIEPYLEEYFFDRLSKAEQFNWDQVKSRIM